eukprot:Pgem_evm1s12052
MKISQSQVIFAMISMVAFAKAAPVEVITKQNNAETTQTPIPPSEVATPLISITESENEEQALMPEAKKEVGKNPPIMQDNPWLIGGAVALGTHLLLNHNHGHNDESTTRHEYHEYNHDHYDD